MLLFIAGSADKGEVFELFQNILCYCLSITIYTNIINNCNFKTSYVIVYPDGDATRALMTQKFQNILCYCLSEKIKTARYCFIISKHLMLLFINVVAILGWHISEFQNILCYCLSSCLHLRN